jgi:hypothetical protein
MTNPTTTPVVELTDAQKRSKAYAEAEKKLRLNHPDEFQDLHEEASKALGLAFKRKLSPAEKAKAEVVRLVQANDLDLDEVQTALVLAADAQRAASLRPAAE